MNTGFMRLSGGLSVLYMGLFYRMPYDSVVLIISNVMPLRNACDTSGKNSADE